MAIIICPECKKELSDTLKVCPHCGFSIKKKNTISKKKVTLLVSIILCMIALGGGVAGIIVYKNSPQVKIMENIESNNLKNAATLYKTLKNGDADKLQKVNDKLVDHLSKVIDDYAKDGTQYKKCEEYVAFIEKYVSTSATVSPKKLLSELKTSKENFLSGVDYQNDKDYPSAVEAFSEVSKSDIENYEKVQDNIKKCKDAYKKVIIEAIDNVRNSKTPENDYSEIQNKINKCDWLTDDKDVSEKLDSLLSVVINSVISHADSLFLEKKYIEAAEYIDNHIPQGHLYDSDVTVEYKKIQKKIVSSTITVAKKKIQKKKYDEALDLINSAMKYDIDSKLSNKKDEVTKLQKNAVIAEFKNLLNKVTIKYDSVADQYIVVKKGFSTEYINISNSVNVEARAQISKSGSAIAYMVLGFEQSDWIFMDSITIASGDTRKTVNIAYGDRNTQVIYTTIAEWVISNQVYGSEKEISELLSADGNVTVRFSGQGSRDHTVSASEKENIKTVHKIVDMLNSYSYLKEYIA